MGLFDFGNQQIFEGVIFPSAEFSIFCYHKQNFNLEFELCAGAK